MAHEALEEIIGRNIARYREAAGLTQAILAEKIGISTAFGMLPIKQTGK